MGYSLLFKYVALLATGGIFNTRFTDDSTDAGKS